MTIKKYEERKAAGFIQVDFLLNKLVDDEHTDKINTSL